MAGGGHYTCDVQGEKGWIRFDDERIQVIPEDKVIEEKQDRQVYMLFYVEQVDCWTRQPVIQGSIDGWMDGWSDIIKVCSLGYSLLQFVMIWYASKTTL